jgi:hypothetical protein
MLIPKQIACAVQGFGLCALFARTLNPEPSPVGSLHPGLLVQVGNIELAAGGVGQQLVVLLQDLVHPLVE